MPRLTSEDEALYQRALDELVALGKNLPRGSFGPVAEKYGVKRETLRGKYWDLTDKNPYLIS